MNINIPQNNNEFKEKVETLIEMGFMELKSKKWDSADTFYDMAISIDPKCPEAYLGKLMVEIKCSNISEIGSSTYEGEIADNTYVVEHCDSKLELVKIIRDITGMRLGDAQEVASSIPFDMVIPREFLSIISEFCEIKPKISINSFESYQKFIEYASKEQADEVNKYIYLWSAKREEQKKKMHYEYAVHRMKEARSEKEFQRVSIAFDKIGGYKNSEELSLLCKEKAKEILYNNCLKVFNGHVPSLVKNWESARDGLSILKGYKDSEKRLVFCKKQIKKMTQGFWEFHQKCYGRNLRAYISVGKYHTIGLRKDGTVVATGKNNYGQCNVGSWRDIIAIATGENYTVGLKSNGSVVATGENEFGQCNVGGWTDIVAIATGIYNTVGLRMDGSIVSTDNKDYGQCTVDDWITAAYRATGVIRTAWLNEDGTVVVTGKNDYGRCDVYEWSYIVAMDIGQRHTVGLKVDGTVVAVGQNDDGRCDVEQWEDIVDIVAGYNYTIALKSDGSVVSKGNNEYGQCNVTEWKDIKVPTNEDLFELIREKMIVRKKQIYGYRVSGVCQYCGGVFKGIFIKKCSSCRKRKDY